MNNPDQYIFVGAIGRSIGTDGTVTIIPWTSFSERFENMNEFFLTKEKATPKTLQVASLVDTGKKLGVKFVGIDDIAAAEKLNGYRITVLKSERYELPEDYYYIDDLKECLVYTVSGELLGQLTDVWEMSSNDIYVIDYKGKELLIPAVGEFLKEVDVSAKKITVALIDGMLPE